jgi:hypothetical protein
MQPFHFETTYQAPSMNSIFAAYFDPSNAAAQDRQVDIVKRTVLEEQTSDVEYHRVCRVVPKRQLPALFRPFVSGELHYVEDLRWYKTTHRVKLDIRPSLLKGRAHIQGDYWLVDEGATPSGCRNLRRIYEGTITMDIPLLGGRIERGILSDLETSLLATAASTQAWIDSTYGTRI